MVVLLTGFLVWDVAYLAVNSAIQTTDEEAEFSDCVKANQEVVVGTDSYYEFVLKCLVVELKGNFNRAQSSERSVMYVSKKDVDVS